MNEHNTKNNDSMSLIEQCFILFTGCLQIVLIGNAGNRYWNQIQNIHCFPAAHYLVSAIYVSLHFQQHVYSSLFT